MRTRGVLRIALALLAGVFVATPAFAARLILAPVADTFVRTDQPDMGNGANPLLIVGDTATPDTALHGLLAFDLSHPALAGATVHDVALELTVNGRDTASGGSLDATHVLDLHALTESFVENSATWLTRDGIVPWRTSGGSFSPQALASASANPGRVNAGDVVSFTGDRLREAVDAALSDDGRLDLLLKLAVEDSIRSVFRFDSRASASAPPRLVVDYTPRIPGHVSAVVPVPGHPEQPLSTRYTLAADGVPVEVRAERFNFDVAMFTMPEGAVVPVEVTIPAGAATWSLRPARHGIAVTREGDTLRFALDRPLRLVLEVGSFTPLVLLATPTESDIPSPADPDVIYFAPGVTDAGVIRPKSGQTVYLAPGALVKGRVEAKNVSNVSIRGRGILETTGYSRREDKTHGILFENSRHIRVEGVGVRAYHTWWQTLFLNSRDIEVAHMNLFGVGVNTDGVDIDGVRDFLVRDTFIRAEDDGLGWHSLDARANGEPVTERARATDIVIWNTGAGNGIRIGASMETQLWRDILIENTDILMHANNGAGIYSDFSDWAWAQDLVFRNVVIDRPKSPIVFKILKTRYSNDTGFLDARGNIERLLFENVTMKGGAITLAGHDADHRIDQVYFNDCTLAGVPLASAAQITTNDHVTNLFFNRPVPEPVAPPPGRHEAEHLESSTNLRPQITYADASLANGKGRALLASAVGDHVEYAIELPRAGLFHLVVGVKRGPASGRFRLSLDGAPLSGEHELHAAVPAPAAIDFGRVFISSPGSHTLRLTVSGKSASSSGHQLDVDYFQLTPALDAFRALHFGADASSEIAADAADPDGDGLPNLIEYALDSDPLRAEPGLVALGRDDDSRLTLSFVPAVTAGLVYGIETSSDLRTWTATALSGLSAGTPVVFVDPTPLAAGERRFLRLRVTLAP